jgi:hypothetical protein
MPLISSTSEPTLGHFNVLTPAIGTDTSLRATHCLQHPSNFILLQDTAELRESTTPPRQKTAVTIPKLLHHAT